MATLEAPAPFPGKSGLPRSRRHRQADAGESIVLASGLATIPVSLSWPATARTHLASGRRSRSVPAHADAARCRQLRARRGGFHIAGAHGTSRVSPRLHPSGGIAASVRSAPRSSCRHEARSVRLRFQRPLLAEGGFSGRARRDPGDAGRTSGCRAPRSPQGDDQPHRWASGHGDPVDLSWWHEFEQDIGVIDGWIPDAASIRLSRSWRSLRNASSQPVCCCISARTSSTGRCGSSWSWRIRQ